MREPTFESIHTTDRYPSVICCYQFDRSCPPYRIILRQGICRVYYIVYRGLTVKIIQMRPVLCCYGHKKDLSEYSISGYLIEKTSTY